MDQVPDEKTAKHMACQSLQLPRELSGIWVAEETIKALEQSNTPLLRWQESDWLEGSLFLLLDTNHRATLGGYLLVYDSVYGLTCQKEDRKNAGESL